MRLAICTVLLAAASQLPAQELTARQLFYQKDEAPAKPAAPQAAPAKPPAAAPARRSAKASRKATPKPVESQPSQAAPAGEPVQAAESTPASITPVVTNAGYIQTPSPLGLRYALVQMVNGEEREVNPQSVFHSGDMVRVKLEGNREGYLYVISRGSSGNWKPLFPSPDISGGENRISPHRRYTVPSSTQAFTFDEQPGEERLFLIYSAEPIQDVQSMFPSLIQPGNAERKAAPASGPPPLLTASAEPITDGFVSRLRETYSRDLIVQTVTPAASGTPAAQAQGGDPMENAVYVVEKSGRPLVADIRLEHR